MHWRTTALLILVSLCAVAAPVLAEESAQTAPQFNVVITDEGAGLLASYSVVRVYAVDSAENVRLATEPVVQLPSKLYPAPANPILLELAPGRYELVVCVPWLAAEVHFMYFRVEDGKLASVDILSVELPAELVTY